MADTPALSDTITRKLAFLWDTLREKHKITEEDVSGYDRERQRVLSRTPPPPSTPGTLKRAHELLHPEEAAGRIGLVPSLAAAEAWFRGIESEYWWHWCTDTDGTEYTTYAGWLDSKKRDIAAELESIWKGRSAVTDRWFDERFKPAVDEALATLIKGRISEARDEAMRRLDGIARVEKWARAEDLKDDLGNLFPRDFRLSEANESAATEPTLESNAAKVRGQRLLQSLANARAEDEPYLLAPTPTDGAPPAPAAANSSEGRGDRRAADTQAAAERAARRQAVVVPILTNKRWKRGRLATEAGLGKNSVYEYLDGTRVKITDDNRKAIVGALGLEPNQLPD